MNYLILALVSAACFVQHAESHSWLDCTKDVGTGLNTGVNDCQGFARGYPGRVGGSNIDRVMTYRIQPGIDGQNGPICAPNQRTANYSSTYYMATARAGETLRLRWTPNGHQKGAGQDPKTYTIHWTGTPNSQLSTRLQLTDANKLAGPFAFDQTCYCNNCAGNPCYGSFTIPPNTAPGIYTFIWYWVFDRNPTGSGEEYTTCFDVKVTGSATPNPTPTSAPAPPKTSQPAQPPKTSTPPTKVVTSQSPVPQTSAVRRTRTRAHRTRFGAQEVTDYTYTEYEDDTAAIDATESITATTTEETSSGMILSVARVLPFIAVFLILTR